MSVVVYKLGGSLLRLPDLPRRLSDLFAVRRDEQSLLVCGGGRAADIVREWDAVHQLGDEHAHWLALRSIQLNEQLLLALCPNELSIVRTRDESATAWHAGRVPLLSLFEFIRDEEPRPSSLSKDHGELSILPHTWDVTSDSLAAWVAIRWPASRLVLLKSVDMPLGGRAFADAYFPTIARDLPIVSWCNFRQAGELDLRPFVG